MEQNTHYNWVKRRKSNISIAIICNPLEAPDPKRVLILYKMNYQQNEILGMLLQATISLRVKGSLIRLHTLLQTFASGRKMEQCIPIAWIKESHTVPFLNENLFTILHSSAVICPACRFRKSFRTVYFQWGEWVSKILSI